MSSAKLDGQDAREAREAGQSSVPLHELKAFRRVALFDPTSHSNDPIDVQFNVSVSKLSLMRPDGSMGLLPGKWKIWVGGTSPRTPRALLRDAKRVSGAPHSPLVASWAVTGND